MSGFEGAYSTILQGVSQQLPKLRLEGQVTAQDNMISDIVTNVRRRPGVLQRYSVVMAGEDYNSIRSWDTDIQGRRVHVFVGVRTGLIRVLDGFSTELLFSAFVPYLKGSAAQAIRGTTVNSEFYLLNVDQKPTMGASVEQNLAPSRTGFFYIRSGTFSKKYEVYITNAYGTGVLEYTTPNATEAGAAAASTPDGIAAGLLAHGHSSGLFTRLRLGANIRGAYVYIATNADTGSTAVTSPSGSSYIQASNASKVRTEADLPAVLPAEANGIVVSVGDQNVFRYYKYYNDRTEWLECGDYGSPASIVNMPVTVSCTEAGAWSLVQHPFEGRFAGDDQTNPFPEFCFTRKISGLAAFQNRLVLLCGSTVYMSASNSPRRFLRTTVTSLLDSDTIAVSSSANSSAEYQYAVPFQKDLILFSRKYQALIPSAGQAITPRTATVLLTSAYSVDTTSEPVPVGRTLLFSAPRSQDYFGFMEMVSSQYTDAQYVANDATAHLPKYMGGACRFGVASSVASMVMFAPSRDPNSLVVYEYSWDGDTKVQQAWHTWRFRYPVATAYFSNETVHVVFIRNGQMIGCTMDPRQGIIHLDSTRRPFLDMHGELTVMNNKCTLPAWVLAFDPAAASVLRLSVSTGPLAGEEVGIEKVEGNTLTTVPSFPNGKVSYGFKYSSLLSPTPPIVKDYNGIPIESTKLTILRFGVSTQNSSEYKVLVTDNTSDDLDSLDQSTLRFSSRELELGKARVGIASRSIIPARTEAGSTSLVMHTDGTGELNVTGLDYIGRYNTRIRRR